MARKRKIVKTANERVRFITLDVYRYLVTGKKSNIRCMKDYETDGNYLLIYYENGFTEKYEINVDEEQLKRVIKLINKRLGGNYDVA